MAIFSTVFAFHVFFTEISHFYRYTILEIPIMLQVDVSCMCSTLHSCYLMKLIA